ncbi:Integral membrane protein [Streptomyces ambofaciens ATCC 23877]|uniref:Integral membrane protein n=1 Tax=Streptomyces ambofaciens (strain ATCC 23877 / 3486 / DSM 40053 / JCM 4204 / NBRC 12836 / NRRL B-2516) TaxID=278992 RepID=A0A0K2AXL9_STRA7|nr:PH domain-containing protein [Streptomyces ambofaciens]AKZ57779.1 Integral membrane protein [Streptomyces ambofaciens ATCC 23877]
MTTPEPQSPPPQPPVPVSKDRIYRSPAGLAGGVLLLALALWLGIDAVVAGEGRTPWTALAALLFLVPLIAAYTVRPAVFANDDRLRVRNPFRVIVLPWGQVASFRSGYSNEVFTEAGDKYQLWSIPVSLRGRKKAARQEARRASGGGRGRGGLLGGLGGGGARTDVAGAGAVVDGPVRAETDKVMDELKELAEARKPANTSQGEVTVRWAYEVLAPVAAGAVLLAVLLGTG